MLRHVAALGFFLLAGCSHATHVAAAPTIVDTKPVAMTEPSVAAPVDTIVLLGAKSIELAADGSEVGSLDALRVAAGARVLTVEQDEAKGAYACDVDYGPGDTFHYDGEFFSRSLTLTAPNGPTFSLVPPIEREEEPNVMGDDKMTSTVKSVIGPYVFVKIEHTFYGCGAAHPLYGVGDEVWSAATGERVTLTIPDGVENRAREAMKDRGFADNEVAFAEAVPVIDAQGRLSVKWRFEKGTAYADSDGQGSAYTFSTFVESDTLPPELEAFRAPPPAVASYLRTHATKAITGWSRVGG